MKVVGLLSGGKDSCYNLCHCVNQGHQLVALATLAPPPGTDELDSYMYQTVGHDAVHIVAEAMQLPLYRQVIHGRPLHIDQSFGVVRSSEARAGTGKGVEGEEAEARDTTISRRDETEDLYLLLRQVKQHHPDVQGVSVGAILSNYQRFRVETICSRINIQLQPLAFLWQRDQSELLAEMVKAGVEAVLIKCAGIGLDQRDLGKTLRVLQPKLEKLKDLYGAHVCGEGGEYETLTLDCPLFKKRIHLETTETVIDSSTSFASVAYMRIHKANLVDKESGAAMLSDVVGPPVLDRLGLRTEEVARNSLKTEYRSTRKLPFVDLSEPIIQSKSPKQAPSRQKGNWVAFSGITADLDQHRPSPDSPTEQTVEVYRIFAKLRQVLSRHQLDLPHIQHLNLSLKAQAAFAETNRVYKEHFHIEPPTRATVALPHLRAATKEINGRTGSTTIELDGWAYDDGSSYISEPSETALSVSSFNSDSTGPPALRQTGAGHRSQRQTLHVQSLSYWASANIGPYSQGLINASRMSIAGQIGLLPVDLSLPSSIETEYALSLQHARRIFEAILEERGRRGKGWVEGGVCWIAQTKPDSKTVASDTSRLKAALRSWGAQDYASHLKGRVSSRIRQGANDPSDGEETRGTRGDEDKLDWLFGSKGIINRSQSAGAHALPMLYALLGPQDLPRGAAVEWQLTAHDGRRRQRRAAQTESLDEGNRHEGIGVKKTPRLNDDDDEDFESEEADRPIARHVTLSLSPSVVDQSFPSFSALYPHSLYGSSLSLDLSHRYISSSNGASSFGMIALRFSERPDQEVNAFPDEEKDRDALKVMKRRLRRALSVKVFVTISAEDTVIVDDGEDTARKRQDVALSLLDSFLTDEEQVVHRCDVEVIMKDSHSATTPTTTPTTTTTTKTETAHEDSVRPSCSLASAFRLSTISKRQGEQQQQRPGRQPQGDLRRSIVGDMDQEDEGEEGGNIQGKHSTTQPTMPPSPSSQSPKEEDTSSDREDNTDEVEWEDWQVVFLWHDVE